MCWTERSRSPCEHLPPFMYIFVDPKTAFRGKTPAATMACGLDRKVSVGQLVMESPAAAGWNPTEGKNAPLPRW